MTRSRDHAPARALHNGASITRGGDGAALADWCVCSDAERGHWGQGRPVGVMLQQGRVRVEPHAGRALQVDVGQAPRHPPHPHQQQVGVVGVRLVGLQDRDGVQACTRSAFSLCTDPHTSRLRAQDHCHWQSAPSSTACRAFHISFNADLHGGTSRQVRTVSSSHRADSPAR